jgi:quercetin dioxygenase-like cupin family protein
VRVLHAEGEHHAVMLRFGPGGTIDEHPHHAEIVVVALEGEGFSSVDGVPEPLHAGQSVKWPAGRPHRLWTEGSGLLALLLHYQG